MLLFRLGFYVFMCVFINNPPTCVCAFISLFYCRPSPICFSFDCFYLLSILLCGFPSERKTAENGRKILMVACCTGTGTSAPCHYCAALCVAMVLVSRCHHQGARHSVLPALDAPAPITMELTTKLIAPSRRMSQQAFLTEDVKLKLSVG